MAKRYKYLDAIIDGMRITPLLALLLLLVACADAPAEPVRPDPIDETPVREPIEVEPDVLVQKENRLKILYDERVEVLRELNANVDALRSGNLSEAERAEVSAAIDRLAEQRDTFTEEIDALEQEVASLWEHRKLKAQREEFEARLARLEADLASLRETVQTLGRELYRIDQRLAQAQTHDAYTELLDEREELRDRHEEALADLEEVLADADETRADLDAVVARG